MVGEDEGAGTGLSLAIDGFRHLQITTRPVPAPKTPSSRGCITTLQRPWPNDSLRGMDASILELESLSEEAALQYLGGDDGHVDPRRVDWIVETAGVTEAPLYLRDCSACRGDPDVAAGQFGEDVEGSAAVFGRGR